MLENVYQARLISKIKELLPGCIVLKNDANYMQGVPDIIILYGKHWFMLEVKRSGKSRFRPNQEYYLDLLDSMSFAACIYPDNEQEILDAIQSACRPKRKARISKR